MSFGHQPVLLEEVVSLLRPEVGKVIVDGTVGGGGHAEALLAQGATVIAVDRDPEAVEAAKTRLSTYGDRYTARVGNFGELPTILSDERALPVDGVLLDLGVSSLQLDNPSRGFSFQADGPLDMRMGREGATAAELLESLDEQALASVIHRYGEERFARRIARSLKKSAPKTVAQAVRAIQIAVPRKAWPRRIHVATRTFQALRIAVNEELDALDRFLSFLPQSLKKGGVAALISFHSLEDRKVKQAFRALAADGTFRALTRKPIRPSPSEIDRNLRSRSARLRAAEKFA